MSDTTPLQEHSENPDNAPRHLITQQTTLVHPGPLPHPAVLKQYNDVVPGAADRIITMAEEQARHRRGIERFCRKFAFSRVLGSVSR